MDTDDATLTGFAKMSELDLPPLAKFIGQMMFALRGHTQSTDKPLREWSDAEIIAFARTFAADSA